MKVKRKYIDHVVKDRTLYQWNIDMMLVKGQIIGFFQGEKGTKNEEEVENEVTINEEDDE